MNEEKRQNVAYYPHGSPVLASCIAEMMDCPPLSSLKIHQPCCFCLLPWSSIVHSNLFDGMDTVWKTGRQCCKHLNMLILKHCTAQHDEELIAENVNTQKADSTHPLLGLCHASSGPPWTVVFFHPSWGKKRKRNLWIVLLTLLSSFGPFVASLFRSHLRA